MTTLGEIAEPSRERALPTEVPAMRYVGLEHIEPQTMRLIKHGYASEAYSSSVRFSKGDVLYGKMRPYLNKVWVAEFDGICSAEFLVFPRCNGLSNQFLASRLNAEDFVTFANGLVSGERPRVDFEKLSHFPILLPPTAEQERIVAKLNTTLSGVERAEAATRRAHERIHRYRATILHAAVIGELTLNWREAQWKSKSANPETSESLLHRLLTIRRARWEGAELQRLRAAGKEPKDDAWKSRYPKPIEPNLSDLPELPEGWCWMSLDQLTFHITSGSRDWSKYYNRGSGTFLMAQNIRRSGLDLSFRQAVDPPADDRDRARSQVAKDDILVTIVGANTGDVCIVPHELPEHFVCQSVALMRLAEPSLSRFIWLYLAADKDGQDQWRGMIYGAGRPHLGFEHLRTTIVPIPPIAEQAEIVREVERRLSAADRLTATLEQQLARTRATRQSLLREAFAGRLVPQNSKDEPALMWFERMRVRHKIEARKPKGKRMPKLKSKAPRRPLLDVLREHKKPITPEQLFREAGFEPSQIDHFYRELASLRDKLKENKPKASEVKSWPYRAHVVLQFEES